MNYETITIRKATDDEIELYEILKSIKGKGRIQLQLHPYGKETITKLAMNQCRIEFHGDDPRFVKGNGIMRVNKISEPFYDFLVREFHNTY